MALSHMLSLPLFAMVPNAGPGQLSRDVPTALAIALQDADEALAFVDTCADAHPKLDTGSAYSLRDHREGDLIGETEAIWGTNVVEAESLRRDRRRHPMCNRVTVARALRQSDAALRTASSYLARATIPLARGAWFGRLQLCQASVESAELRSNLDTGRIALTIVFAPEAKAEFAAMTRHATGRIAALRVDGAIVAEPRIDAPILQGRIFLAGPDPTLLERARSLAVDIC